MRESPSGLHQQAGHMTASDTRTTRPLAGRGHPHMHQYVPYARALPERRLRLPVFSILHLRGLVSRRSGARRKRDRSRLEMGAPDVERAQAIARAEGHRGEIAEPGHQHDRWPRGQVEVIG
jgi:hypothetical protein